LMRVQGLGLRVDGDLGRAVGWEAHVGRHSMSVWLALSLSVSAFLSLCATWAERTLGGWRP